MKSERARRDQAGVAYVEVLVATVLLAVALVPALDALRGSLVASEVHETLAFQQHHLAGGLEEVLAEPYEALEAAAIAAGGGPSSYSDAVATPDRRLVYLSGYDGDDADADGDPFTGIDPGLLWVRVEIEGTPHSLETLTAE